MLTYGLFITCKVIVFQKPPWLVPESGLITPDEGFFLTIEIIIKSNNTIPETINNTGPSPTVKTTIKKPMKYSDNVRILGTSKLLTLSPSKPIIAGNSVIPAKTATKTTSTVPTPNA